MADFVLVHGAWHGAWCWQRVLPGLWAAGHRAFAVTLTGLGERAHLLSPSITLDTHIADVLGVIETEELRGAILVGHSYGGMVITGAADRLAARAEQDPSAGSGQPLAQLVYLDAVVPNPGECWSSGHSDETRAARRDTIARLGVLPPPDPTVFGLSGADAAWVARRQTPQPGGVYDAPLRFDPERIARLPRTFIDCTSPALATIAISRERVRSEPGWAVVELDTGHDAMISAPQDVTRALLERV